jgi:hypothetical protein
MKLDTSSTAQIARADLGVEEVSSGRWIAEEPYAKVGLWEPRHWLGVGLHAAGTFNPCSNLG